MSIHGHSKEEFLSQKEIAAFEPQYAKRVSEQFLHIYETHKDRDNDEFKYGDEMEYTFLDFDDSKKNVKVSLKAAEVKEKLENKKSCNENGNRTAVFYEEFASFQLEGVPSEPYSLQELLQVEQNLKLRKTILQSCLESNERAVTISAFPRLGCRGYTTGHVNIGCVRRADGCMKGLSKHSEGRYRFLSDIVSEIKKRCGPYTIPVYQDFNTINKNCSIDVAVVTSALQVTMQAKSLEEAKTLSDNMTALAPIMLALSAATPVVNGLLLDKDTRWWMKSEFMHDSVKYNIYKDGRERSQFGKSPDYLTPGSNNFNDKRSRMNAHIHRTLQENGVESLVAKYYTSMFTPTPWTLSKTERDSKQNDTHLVQNAQSTFWSTVRLKIPLKSTEGWRVEFRVCDPQLTDFQNAAFIVFTVLFAKISTYYNLDLRISTSLVEENMQTADKRNAVLREGFWFVDVSGNLLTKKHSINYIINGEEGGFEGLVPLMQKYLKTVGNFPRKEMASIQNYIEHISDIAAGRKPTVATWMRNYIMKHGRYNIDSIVTDEIQYDLLKACDNI